MMLNIIRSLALEIIGPEAGNNIIRTVLINGASYFYVPAPHEGEPHRFRLIRDEDGDIVSIEAHFFRSFF